jgi:RNA polymerase sigma-70 factor (ECF subfamily)
MNATEREVLEEQLRALCGEGRRSDAATMAVRAYGPEILGFLAALHRDPDEAADVFSQFCEDLWRGLPSFELRASFRTWLYVLARHASYRYFRRQTRRKKAVRLADCPELEQVAARVRTATMSFLRSQSRDRLTALRESLPPDDQALLILRVDKNLDWNDLARVFHPEETLQGKALEREAARLRKRYQLLKDRLRELVRAATRPS